MMLQYGLEKKRYYDIGYNFFWLDLHGESGFVNVG